VSIRDLFDQGLPDPAHPATAWGEAVSDRVGQLLPVTGGWWYDGALVVSGGPSGPVSANQQYSHAVYFTHPVTIDRLGLMVSGAIAGGLVKLGVFALLSPNLVPNGAALVQTGGIDVSTTGFKEATISLALDAGWYGLASIFSVAGGSMRQRTNSGGIATGYVTSPWQDGAQGSCFMKSDGQSYANGLTDWGGTYNQSLNVPSVRARVAT
jgi:hypothetical protein